MSNILLLKSVHMTHQQIPNEILCPYILCLYVVLYILSYNIDMAKNFLKEKKEKITFRKWCDEIVVAFSPTLALGYKWNL